MESQRSPKTLEVLKHLERQVLWHACWMIHNANHIRDKGEVKVGGHQASSASMVSIMTALYFHTLKPEDRVAVKPHASPVFHAIQYLMGNQTRENLVNFRGFGGAQSYPSRTKDIDDVDFSTGSVGLGVAVTAFASIVQDYINARSFSSARSMGRMIALVGDAELDEGNIYECLQEGWKHDLRNTWWIVDYNRQSLDGVVREGLWKRIQAIFTAFGWDVRVLKHGVLQESAFREPGGEALRAWIDRCPNQLYSALAYQGGAAWRKRLIDEIGDQGAVTRLIEQRTDAELSELMNNLGGHCIETLTNTFESIDHDRPTVFLAYTIKGWGTPLAGHKDNHAGLMTKAQMEEFRSRIGVSPGREWDEFGAIKDTLPVKSYLGTVPFFAKGTRRYAAAAVASPGPIFLEDRELSTQAGFGKILDAIARRDDDLANRIVTTAPDVTVSTNLGPWVNRRGLFAREAVADTFQDEKVASTQKWSFGPRGQHIELGIAEMNLFLLLGAAGLSHSLFGERLIPIGTVYDPFVARGLDALNYACYQDSRFMIVGTPSGVTLAPEGGAHQSIGQQLIGMSQDGLASFEPAYLDELSVIMDWSFNYMQREGKGGHDPRTWLRDEAGGSVYLRLTTRPLEQPTGRDSETFRQGVIDGAYWLRKPQPNTSLVLAYQGCVAPEVLIAAGRLAELHRDVAVLAVTSADRLNAGWTAAQRARRHGYVAARSHVEDLLAQVPPHAHMITVTDGHPATLGWLGSVHGHPLTSLGVEHFGQTGTVADLYAHFGIDTDSLIEAAEAAVRHGQRHKGGFLTVA
ncbi:transketolase-like TK C-terminal-containing protein [Rhizobium rosettiformans]|uniref:transketolase-like TK C-terminal-containing protein n=1 Tax=Rhizobium rosettiformans TaxID=1368430 RepID=UPI0028582BE7|nr:transketolase [Rhizobium rosettiformans]MDR7030969.1 pyruvate dehydrogenase E1 component [Rhizobium rosettiformans]MDR7066812.1 pyruvate dehydrogenase E1 component [Rhizobium rosettiformans]